MSEVTKQVAIELQVDGESAYAVESVPALVPIDTDDTGAVTDHTNKSITIYGRKGANARAAATITNYTLPAGFTFVSNSNGVLTFKAGSQATLATSANVEITATYDGLTFGMLIPIVPAKQGEAGTDADDTEWIYKYDANGYTGTAGEVNPSGAASGNDTNEQQKGWVPNGWYDHALAISGSNPTVYASYRTLNGATGQWGAFQTPIEWSHWGRNGQDGDGTEYVFIRTQNNVAPVMDSTQTGYSAAKFCPTITSASQTASGTEQAQTTDNPKGANETYPFEWCAKRTMTSPDSSGARTWDKFKGNIVNGTPDYKMSLWDNFAKSIEKASADTYRYATNNTGTRPAADSQDWSTTKPTLQEGYWLYTETTVHWSDGSTTVLYNDERNPNDGQRGQDIVVDGSTVMKYYVGTSNTTHPADSSSDWKDLSQVTQEQGKWLWSQATTYYRKADSASGSHDAGSSINYNVSYISKDGKTGRGISSITEYYQATNSSAARQKPSSASGWDTDPNLSNLTDKWDANHRYLWNMEMTVYSNVDGTPTTEYSVPQILAIWTEDGDPGKGIDSITNYYKCTNSTTAPARAHEGGTGWQTSPVAPDANNPYLWNYEMITWVNYGSGSPYTYTDPQMIGHYGKDGTNGETPAFLYKWETSVDAPTVTAPNYVAGTNLGGWSKTAPNKVDGKKLWMSQQVLLTAANGTYSWKNNAWSTPIVISGEDGDPGADSKEREWIYIRQTTYPFSGTAPASITKDTSGTTRSAEYIATHDDFVPQGWSDNALPATDSEKYVYTSWRDYDTSTERWGAFQTPILWSNWGVQGMDGDGVQYIYKLFDHELTDSERTSNIPTKPSQQNSSGEWLPISGDSNWYDDPQAPTSSMNFCYCSIIKRINGTWGSYEKLGLWSKWAEDGQSPYFADLNNEMDAVSVDQFGYIPQLSLTEGSITYAAKVQTTAKLFKGSTPQSFTLKVYDEGGTEYTNNGSYRNGIKVVYTSGSQTSNIVTVYFNSGASIGDKKVFTIKLNDTYEVKFTVKGVQGDIYQLLPNIDEVVFGVDSTTNQWTPPSIGVYCGYTKNVGGTKTEYAGNVVANTWKSGGAPYNIFYRYQNADGTWTAYSWNKDLTNGTISVGSNTTYNAIQFVLTSATGYNSIAESNIVDRETVYIVKSGKRGDEGTSPIIVDLDNDSDQFGTDSTGLTLSAQSKATGVKLYYGTTPQTITKLVATVYRASAPSTSIGSATATTSGTEVSSNVTISSTKVATIKSLFNGTSGTITFGIVNNVTINDDFIIKIEAFRSSSESRTANFTLKQVKSGAAGVAPDLCNLRPTLAKVSFTKSELSGSTAKTLGCGYTLVTPSGTTNTATAASVSVNGTTYYIWWRYVGGTYAKFTTSSTIYSTGILPSTTQTGVEFVLSSASSASNIAAANTLDYENVPIIKDGTDGKNSIRLALDNEHEDFIYSGSGKVAPSSVLPITATIYDGGTPIAGENVGWQIDTSKSSGTEIKNSGNPTTATYTGDCAYIGPLGDLKVNGLTADSAKIVVKAKYPNDSTGQYYYATFSANKTQQDKYDLVAKPNAIAFNDDETWTDKTIAISADRTDLQGNKTTGVTIQTTAVDGLRLYYKYVNANGTMTSEARMSSTSFTLNQTNARAYIGVYFELRLYSGSDYRLCDYETVEIAKVENGENGDDSYYVSTNPQVIYIETDSSGKVTDTTNHTIYVPFFKGNASSSTNGTISSATCSSDAINIVSTGSDYSRRINGISGKTLSSPVNVVFTATAYGVTRTTNLIVIPNKKGANGNDAIHIDLDNENDAIQYMGGSNLTGSVTSQARLYGATGTISIDSSASTIGEDYCSIDGGLITVSDVMDSDDQNILSGIVVVKATVNNVDYYATFTVQRLDNGQPKYEIEIDSPVIIGNMDAASASVTVGVKVYRTAINTTTNLLERSLVSDLSTYNLKLWRRASTATNPTDYTTSYSSGWDMTINVKGISTSITDYTLYLTKDNVSAANAKTNYYDIEKIPVQRVYNGIQGEKGDAARQPYEWGTWENFIANNSNKFVANKYEAPYFLKDEQVTVDITGDNDNVKRIQQNKWLWVGEDGEYVPPGATPGPGQQNAPIPSSQSEKWELMVTDFKYLISEAQIADYGKFGAGIFSRDYAFSQYGRVDGQTEDIMRYQNFRPEFFKGQPYEFLASPKNIGSAYPSSTPYEFGRLFLEAGVTYTIKFTLGASWSSYIHFRVIKISSGAELVDWSGQGSSPVKKTISFNSDSYNGEYSFQAYTTNTSYTLTFQSIKVSVNKAFRPNIYIDWLKGEIYSQLGRFVNITVEGVINNLIHELTSANYTNWFYSFTSGKAWLDPLQCGTILWLNNSFFTGNLESSCRIMLPCACSSGKIGKHSYSKGYGDLTLDEIRQCVGKKIYILHENNNVTLTYECAVSGVSMLVYKNYDWENLSNLSTSSDYIIHNDTSSYVRRCSNGEYQRNSSSGNNFTMLECKMGIYDNTECIYWEVTMAANTLDDYLG